MSSFAQGRSLGGNDFNSDDINAKPGGGVEERQKIVKRIEYVAVSPLRDWKSSGKEQTVIKGTLLAFAREKTTGKLSIVENETVRLLVGKKDFTLPLAKLSAEDRAYIASLVDSARQAGKLIEPVKD